MRSSAQSAASVLLGLIVIGAWALTLSYALFMHRWTPIGMAMTPFLVAFMCWLDVGLFILAHDAMHGSLVPASRRLNRALGSLCLGLYGGFRFERFRPHHFEHHRWPGTAKDPDFAADRRTTFWRWYGHFMGRYLGWREVVGLAGAFVLLVVGLGAPMSKVLMFWALPAALSSVQLFAFGTWLPHRGSCTSFADHHRARSNEYGWWASLITCFHFGYHHEHHIHPDAPWWSLPAVRSAFKRSGGAPGGATSSPWKPSDRDSDDSRLSPPTH